MENETSIYSELSATENPACPKFRQSHTGKTYSVSNGIQQPYWIFIPTRLMKNLCHYRGEQLGLGSMLRISIWIC